MPSFSLVLILFLFFVGTSANGVRSHVSVSINQKVESFLNTSLFHTFNCQITEEVISLSCSITLKSTRLPRKDGKDLHLSGCHNYSKDYLSIILDLTTDITSFECISKDPFALSFDFENAKPRVQFMKFKRQRIFQNFFDPDSYFFKLKMVVPRNQYYEIEYKKTSWFTYTLFSLNPSFGNHKLKIRFCLQSRTVHHFYNFHHVKSPIFYDLSLSNTTIMAAENIVYVPCFSLQKIHLYLMENVKLQEPHSMCFGTNCAQSPGPIRDITNLIISYNPLEGFKINVSSLWNKNGTLMCVGESLKDLRKCKLDVTCMAFRFLFPPSEQYDPKNSSMHFQFNLLKSKRNLLLKPEKFRLTCSSTKTPVSIIPGWYSDRELFETAVMHNYSYEMRKPEHRFFTEVELSYFQKNESVIHLKCVESKNMNKVIHVWRIYFDVQDRYPTGLTFNSRQKKFICQGNSYNHVPLIQIECGDIYECRAWERSLQNQVAEEGTCKDQSVPLSTGTTCEAQSTKKRVDFCVSASPIEKAYIQCFAPPEQLPREIFKDIHFKGFDGNIYTQVEVPTEAILKLECSNKESYIILDDKVTCSCEGHSFFHTHGIHWLLVFINGSMQSISKYMIAPEKLPESRDKHNPLSIVSILFKFREIKSIICAAPLLNSKKWQNVTKNIQILDGMVPKIFSLDKEKEIAEGEKSFSLSCASEGRPMANVEWSHNNRPIEDPVIVISQGVSKMLIFPEYIDSFHGEYECTASNRFGNDTKVISISTLCDSPVLGTGTIFAVGLAICLVLAALLTFYLVRRLRASQKLVILLTNEEVEEFFNGVDDISEKSDHAFALPYDDKYELSAESFLINRKQVLGSGEFGTVYKGTIYNYEGEFAFKAALGTSEGLRALLSELKIMVYIGAHENILKLIGAYTKDVKMGVLYIATELCGLGCLRPYLIKMKQDIEADVIFSSTNTFFTFLRWCEEIANGMEYLSSMHVVHSDLAARNILLTVEEVVKISDFGLSRRMTNYCDYKKMDKSNPLPWKWMAIESLKEMTFSTQSDVWAYGITIWEIFSFGNVPYPGISWAIEFVEMLDRGLRNVKPEHATDKL